MFSKSVSVKRDCGLRTRGKRIVSETRAQGKLSSLLINYLGFLDEKITNLSCSLSLNQVVIIYLLNNKSRNIAQKETKIENRNCS